MHQTGKRRVVIAMRERGGRTLPFVVRSEDAALPTIVHRVQRGSTVHADEASHRDALRARFATETILDGLSGTAWAGPPSTIWASNWSSTPAFALGSKPNQALALAA